MPVYIVTGASQGIGDAIATFLEQDDHNSVLRIARHNPNQYPNFIEGDLTLDGTLDKIKNWLIEQVNIHEAFYLINNAGIVEPMGIVGKITNNDVSKSFELNVVALIKLCNLFVSTLHDIKASKVIMNISSGAGRKPYTGWGVYGATKAAVDHFTTILCEEQKRSDYPVRATSIAPGTIDTEMQTTIRNSDSNLFPLVDSFKQLKAENKLSSPKEVAQKLINYLHSEQMGTEPITDIRTIN